MEIPDYLLNKYRRERLFAAFEKIPAVISEIAEHEGIRSRPILLTVYGYTANGLIISLDYFWLSKQELLRHIDKAEALGYEMTVQRSKISVRRILPDGKYFLSEYTQMDSGR